MHPSQPSEDERSAKRRKRLRSARNRRYQRRKKNALRLTKRLSKTVERGLAPIATYDDLVRYLIARRKALGMTTLELDERAGFPTGYSTKLENWKGPQGRVAGSTSMALWFEALGVKLRPIADEPAKVERPRLNGADLARRIPASVE
jgi:hypothetical protein